MGLPTEKIDNIICSDVTFTEGNGVANVTICGEEFTGKQLRELLELPSTVFSITVSEDNSVNIMTDGNGHRVGLSQYGANAMAISGIGYQEILLHYYPGTVIHRLSHEEIKGLFDKAGNL